MNLPGQLYKLQQIDSEIQRQRQYIEDIVRQLSGNQILAEAEDDLAQKKQQLTDMIKSQRTVEWELEDLTARDKDINSKLYTGVVRNPKDLLGLKHEAESLKTRISNKEDVLLGIMAQAEEMEEQEKASTQKVNELKQEWKKRQKNLVQQREETESELTRLGERREDALRQIEPKALGLYQQLKKTKEPAVAIVQQGQCQGCHMILPIGKWQKAEVGEIVQCSNCSRILYVQ
jgi:predicted  nucleic acid-binding Zn-ribbon protein